MTDPALQSTLVPVLIGAVPLLIFIAGRLWGEARATRKAFHATRLGEDEASAYKTARDGFIALRKKAVRDVQRHDMRLAFEERGESLPSEGLGRDTLREEAERALERFREIVLIGPTDLSKEAVGVIQDYLRWYEGPDRSDTHWAFYEDDMMTKRYLGDFVERRKVDLGQTSAFYWYARKWWRGVINRLRGWRRWLETRRQAS